MNYAETSRPSVLLVDDKPANLVALSKALENLDCNIVKVCSGQDALFECLNRKFACVLLDVKMPEMDGFETAKIIKNSKEQASFPIIFITGHSESREDIKKGYELGAIDYITKPINARAIAEKVKIYCELFRRRDAAELADQLCQVNAALKEANRKLSLKNTEILDIFYTISHELMTPVGLINTFSSALSDKLGARPDLDTKEEDFVEHLFVANTHSYILFFTDKGVVHWLKTYKIPEAGRYARGSAVINLLKLNQDEKITSMVAVDEFKENNYLVMATKNGIIKKTSLVEYSRPRQGGIIGINLRENDRLIDVKMTDGTKQMIIATKDGRAVRFKESDVNAVGRNSIGVRGINVRNSKVVGMEIVNAPYLLTVTEKGYGKRSEVNDYRLINRGGSGVTNIKITEKNGNVVGIKIISENDEIMLISKNGVIIRTPVSGISVIGRNTQGVRIMNLEEGDGLATVARIINEESDLDRKEDFKPSDESLPSDDVVNDGEEIENAADEIKFIEDNKEIINDNDQEIKNDSNISEEEIKEFLEKNNVDSKKEEKSSKKDFTLEGYGGN